MYFTPSGMIISVSISRQALNSVLSSSKNTRLPSTKPFIVFTPDSSKSMFVFIKIFGTARNASCSISLTLSGIFKKSLTQSQNAPAFILITSSEMLIFFRFKHSQNVATSILFKFSDNITFFNSLHL